MRINRLQFLKALMNLRGLPALVYHATYNLHGKESMLRKIPWLKKLVPREKFQKENEKKDPHLIPKNRSLHIWLWQVSLLQLQGLLHKIKFFVLVPHAYNLKSSFSHINFFGGFISVGIVNLSL